MEGRVKRKKRLGLTALFWRYLLTTAVLAVMIFALWWITLMVLIRSGVVLPAATAEWMLTPTVEAIGNAPAFDEALIPYWYRWARFDADGTLAESGALSESQLRGMKNAYGGQLLSHGFPYGKYHARVPLSDGSLLILQYDYSTPYSSAWAQRYLPDFQVCMAVILLLLLLSAAMATTRCYTRILKRDAALLTAATEAIASQRLDEPLEDGAGVRELSAVLETIEKLRQTLAGSLGAQWAMEEQRSREIAALAHDLKTPLTIIGGNAELLFEEELTPAQRRSAETIARSACHIGTYVEQLRMLSAQMRPGMAERGEILLSELFSQWRGDGEGLCAPKGIRFEVQEPPEVRLRAERDALRRAVLNLMDNAVRFTPRGGTVALGARAEENMLTLTVRDTGPGFSQEALLRAGRILYTGDASRPRDGHSGIGLCYVRQVAQRHGGELYLTNTDCGASASLTVRIE